MRIAPTYAVAANVLHPYQTLFDMTGLSWLLEGPFDVAVSLQYGLLDSYTGLILPLVATAIGIFLYRQFFLTLPDELVEATKMDGAGPIRFFFEMLLSLSQNNMAALFTIMFVMELERISVAPLGHHRPGPSNRHYRLARTGAWHQRHPARSSSCCRPF